MAKFYGDDSVITIGFDANFSKNTLSDRIRSLPTPKSNSMNTVDIVQKSKKKKKKKKAKTGDEFLNMLNEMDEEAGEETESGDIDALVDNFVDGEDDYDEEDELDSGIIYRQKENYGKRNKDKEYVKHFNDESTLLYTMLESTRQLTKVSEKDYKAITTSRSRGASKYANDMLSNIVSLRGNELQIVKELVSIKKMIADLDIKKSAQEARAGGGDVGGLTMADATAVYLNTVMSKGRSGFIETLGGSDSTADASDVDNFDYDEEDDDEAVYERNAHYNDILAERLERDGNTMRDKDGNAYIEQEHQNSKIEVRQNIETGDWRFIAIGEDGLELSGYPLPDPANVGKMTFTETFAKDSRGRMYNLQKVYDELY